MIERGQLIQVCPSCNGRGSIDTAGAIADPYGSQILMCRACSATGEVLTEAGQMAWHWLGSLVERHRRERIEARYL